MEDSMSSLANDKSALPVTVSHNIEIERLADEQAFILRHSGWHRIRRLVTSGQSSTRIFEAIGNASLGVIAAEAFSIVSGPKTMNWSFIGTAVICAGLAFSCAWTLRRNVR